MGALSCNTIRAAATAGKGTWPELITKSRVKPCASCSICEVPSSKPPSGAQLAVSSLSVLDAAAIPSSSAASKVSTYSWENYNNYSGNNHNA